MKGFVQNIEALARELAKLTNITSNVGRCWLKSEMRKPPLWLRRWGLCGTPCVPD